MRPLSMLLVSVLLVQLSLYGMRDVTSKSTSMLFQEELILPLPFTPLILQKPMMNASWQGVFHDLAFQKVTTIVFELEPLALAGSLDSLEVEVTINGRTTTQRYEGNDYSFEAATQLGLLVDATARKLDDTTDIKILLKPHWGLVEAGVLIKLAQLWSFEPRPAFGGGRQRVPLSVEWNSYRLGSIPPLTLYFATTGFLGNTSDNNQLELNIYLEVLGVEDPWVEVFMGTKRFYQGNEARQWINTTVNPPQQNLSYLNFSVEYHPHRSADRHKEATISLSVYAEITDSIDPQAAEREQILEEMPAIPEVIANLLILNAIILPLAHFRKQQLEQRKFRFENSKALGKASKESNRSFSNRKHHNR